MASFVRLDEDAAFLEQRVKRFHAVRERVLEQVRAVIVGQDEVLDQILIALFVGGHCLLTGMPGTAKTLMVRTIAEALGLARRDSRLERVFASDQNHAWISNFLLCCCRGFECGLGI